MRRGIKYSFQQMFAQLLKWRIRHLDDQRFIILLSVFLGIEIAVIVVMLKSLVLWIKKSLDAYQFINPDTLFIYVLLPIVGIALTQLVIRLIGKGKLDRGISFILYAIGRNSSIIRGKHRFSQAVTGALTVGFGGSVGLEAPVVVTGAAWGSYYGRLFHLNSRQTTILIGCGAAAAISAIFNAPVAGVIFVMEVIITNINIVFVVPLLIAAVVGTFTSSLLMQEEALFHIEIIKDPRNFELLFYILLGLVCGLLSIYFNNGIYWVQHKVDKLKKNKHKVFLGGLLLGFIILLLPALYGEGYFALSLLMNGQANELISSTFFSYLPSSQWVLIVFLVLCILLKVVATGLTRSLGGIGGVFAPTMFTGGIAGFLLARVLNIAMPDLALSEASFLLVGMAGVSSGVLHSPLTKVFLIAEITQGYELLIPLMIVAAISYAIKFYFDPHSFYTKELVKRGDYILNDKDKTVLQDIKMSSVIERNFVTVNVTDKLGDLVEAVARSERNIFPVLGENRSLKGIILLNDVRKFIFKPELYTEKEVKYLMRKPPEIIEIGEDMETVMNKFDKTNAWNLPVIKNGSYEGFLSKSKIFSIYRNQLKSITRELG